MKELQTLTIGELRTYKRYLIGLIKDKSASVEQLKEYQRKTRQIDKMVKSLIMKG